LLPLPPGLQLLVNGFPCLALRIEKKLTAPASQQEKFGFVESHCALQVASIVPDRRLLDCEEAIPEGLVWPLHISPFPPVKPSSIGNYTSAIPAKPTRRSPVTSRQHGRAHF
jgi:hypothetical protein